MMSVGTATGAGKGGTDGRRRRGTTMWRAGGVAAATVYFARAPKLAEWPGTGRSLPSANTSRLARPKRSQSFPHAQIKERRAFSPANFCPWPATSPRFSLVRTRHPFSLSLLPKLCPTSSLLSDCSTSSLSLCAVVARLPPTSAVSPAEPSDVRANSHVCCFRRRISLSVAPFLAAAGLRFFFCPYFPHFNPESEKKRVPLCPSQTPKIQQRVATVHPARVTLPPPPDRRDIEPHLAPVSLSWNGYSCGGQ